jgi:hypothetical protein
VLAAVIHRLARPGGAEDLERLVEHLRALAIVDLFAGARVLSPELVAAKAYAERQPAAAEHVQRRRLARDLDRPPPGQRRDHRAEPDALGRGRNRRQRDLRVGDMGHGRPPVDVIPHEHPIPSGLLGLDREARDQPWIGELVEERHVDP